MIIVNIISALICVISNTFLIGVSLSIFQVCIFYDNALKNEFSKNSLKYSIK